MGGGGYTGGWWDGGQWGGVGGQGLARRADGLDGGSGWRRSTRDGGTMDWLAWVQGLAGVNQF